jgi:hypothetical protein
VVDTAAADGAIAEAVEDSAALAVEALVAEALVDLGKI